MHTRICWMFFAQLLIVATFVRLRRSKHGHSRHLRPAHGRVSANLGHHTFCCPPNASRTGSEMVLRRTHTSCVTRYRYVSCLQAGAIFRPLNVGALAAASICLAPASSVVAQASRLWPRSGGLKPPFYGSAIWKSPLVLQATSQRRKRRRPFDRRRMFLLSKRSYFFSASCISCIALCMSSCAFFIASNFCCCSGVSNGRICAPVLSMIARIFSIAS